MKLYNAKIYTMDAQRRIIQNGYVEYQNGIITQVAEGVPENISEEDIDCKKADLYPGFIDAHTHVGLSGNGAGIENEDLNEECEPCTPQLRIIDGVDPFDKSFENALAAGITTVVISPGSANPIAGEIYAFSTHGKRADKMALRRIGIKFSLGENPKMTYMDREESPYTRMATAAIIREELAKAKRYMHDKELAAEESDLPELDVKHEALIPLLKGEIAAHIHCHRADDIFTALRISKEFGLRCVLIHCSDGHLIADELAEEGNICAVIGPIINDPCKPELKNVTPRTAGILSSYGIKTAICTDHSETPIEYLPLTVGIAIKYGMTRENALSSVTINAAEIAGIADIAGSIEIGKRADLVVFDEYPFEVMSAPKLVICGGVNVTDASIDKKRIK